MPRLVKSSSPVACVRLVISTTSTPPTRTAGAIAHRYLGRAEALPGVALEADDLDLGVDRLARASGDLAAEAQPDPRRRAPRRSNAARRSGSQIGPEAGDSRPCCSIRWRRMSVLSDGAPPPALSAGSAITTGRSLKRDALRPSPRRRRTIAAWVLPRRTPVPRRASSPAHRPSSCRRRRSPARACRPRPRRRRGSNGRSRRRGCRPCPPSP